MADVHRRSSKNYVPTLERGNDKNGYRGIAIDFYIYSAKSSFSKTIHKSLIHKCKFCIRSGTS